MPFQFKKGETLKSQARKIVHNVAEFCSHEAAVKSLTIPLAQALKRACQATGISEFTIKKIKNEVAALDKTGVLSTPGKHRKRPSDRNCEIGDFDKCVIRQTIQDFYIRERKVPPLRTLLPVVRERINFPWNKDTLCKVLHSMNFRWKKCVKQKKVLIEKPGIVFRRTTYLREIKKHRESGRQIVYIDGTWVDSNLTFKKCWNDDAVSGGKSNVNLKNRFFVMHAGSSAGFISGAQLTYDLSEQDGDYHGQMNYAHFEKWVLEKLIPNLQPNSVICMDDAPYHMKVENPTPSKYTTKKLMVGWLTKNGICCDAEMSKAELFSLIESNSSKKVTYKIDNIIQEKGHYVVRLPPLHCDLNAFEYVWSTVKKLIKEMNITNDLSSSNFRNILCQTMDGVTSEEWQIHCNHVEELENLYLNSDGLLEEIVDEIAIQINSSDSDSDSDETEFRDSDFDDSQDIRSLPTPVSSKKFSSMLTTKVVDIRNSVKRESADHEPEPAKLDVDVNVVSDVENSHSSSNSAIEEIVVTPTIFPPDSSPPQDQSKAMDMIVSSRISEGKSRQQSLRLKVKAGNNRKRNANESPTHATQNMQFADINLPDIEKYRKIYPSNPMPKLSTPSSINVSSSTIVSTSQSNFLSQKVSWTPSMTQPLISASASQQLNFFVPQGIGEPQLALSMAPNTHFPIIHSFLPQQPLPISVCSNNPGTNTVSIPVECILQEGNSMSVPAPEHMKQMVTTFSADRFQNKAHLEMGEIENPSSSLQLKIRDTKMLEDEEDGDKPLATLIGHPTDQMLRQQICEIVGNMDVHDISMDGIIQRIFNIYPKFDLKYRREFIKSTVKFLLADTQDSKKDVLNDSKFTSPNVDSSVTTTSKWKSTTPCLNSS